MAGEIRGARKQPNAVLIGHHSLEGGSRRCGALAGAAGADERLPRALILARFAPSDIW